MKKILVMLVICLLLMGGTALAKPKVYVCDTNSGATMGPAGTGVSLILVVNIIKDNITEEDYSIQLTPVTFGGSGAVDSTNPGDNADPGGTGITGDAGTTITFRYGVSNTHLTTAQWQAKTTSGTTHIVTHNIDSGSTVEPFEFAPEPSSQLAIFAYSGCSQFLVPKAYLFAR